MNTKHKKHTPARTLFAAVLAGVLAGGLATALHAAEAPSGAEPQKTSPSVAQGGSATQQEGAAAQKTEKPAPAQKELTGAELYSMNCNRCHQERYPTERTGAQWKTIMLHMQVRANIPADQARKILQYLQENSGR